jgi:hypothetical protein
MEHGHFPDTRTRGRTTYAIADDLSCVLPTDDGFGIFTTELEAIETLILHLESNKTDVVDKIAKAKARRRRLNRRKP